MPEHVHLLMGEPRKGDPSVVLKMLKQRVSWKLRRESGFAGFEGEELRRFWQARFYDFNVYSERKKREKLEYMHANPVIRRLVEQPRDWPWSSWANYVKSGEVLLTIDPR